jgi:trimeric autotransporter adhesin
VIQPNSPNATIPGGTGNKAAGNGSFAAGSSANAATANSFVWSDGSATTTATAAKQFMVRASGGMIIYSGSGTSSGVSLSAGGGSWNNLSDRNAKEKFTSVASQNVLARLAGLPITKWSYKTESGVTHIGPMAQDFYSAFGVGEDERHISTVDEEGVALAAIQGLNQKLEEQQGELKDKDKDILQLQENVAELKAMVLKLAQNQSK